MRIAPFPAIALCLWLAWTGAAAADAQRGRALYEGSCAGCHAGSVHGRAKREATDFEAVRGWVRRWSANLRLNWTDEEITDVAVHLNERYYRFACPADDCRTTGSREEGGPRLALDARPR